MMIQTYLTIGIVMGWISLVPRDQWLREIMAILFWPLWLMSFFYLVIKATIRFIRTGRFEYI